MTLTVEDGTGISGADTYISLADARAYAKGRGLTLSDYDDELEQQLRKSLDYIETFRDRFKGTKAAATNVLQWPRLNVSVDGYAVTSTTIPTVLKNAQVELAAAIQSGYTLEPVATGESFVTMEKVGEIETRYSASVSTTGVPIIRKAHTLLAPLIEGGFNLTVSRA